MPMPMPMGLHPGMAFPGQPSPFPPSLYPPGQQWRPNLFNPFGLPLPSIPPTPSSPRNNHQQVPSFDGSPRSLSRLLDQQKAPKKPHIKKPLNAFMLYMKEQRAKVIAECTLKESSAINKVLGQKWKQLARSEQDKYYEMAKEERLRHMQLYPGWSARDNYGIKKKRANNSSSSSTPGHRKQQREKAQMENGDCGTYKKCRASFGLERQSEWCKHCRRKKKCTRFTEENCFTAGGGSSADNLSGKGTESSLESGEEEEEEFDDDGISGNGGGYDSNEENRMNLTLTNHNRHHQTPPRSVQSHPFSYMPPHAPQQQPQQSQFRFN